MNNILCSLSSVLRGQSDCIEIIYRKKLMIEKNEIIQYHLLNGLENRLIYGYTVCFSDFNEYYLTTEKQRPENMSVISTADRVLNLKMDEQITNEFLLTFILYQCKKDWILKSDMGRHGRQKLENDTRYCNHVLLNCLNIQGFIRMEVLFPEKISMCNDYDIRRFFKDPSLKQKIKALNFVFVKYGAVYLNMIKNEFLNYDIYVCILLKPNGEIESIMGGS